jgi:hypothetical protein
MSFNRFRKWFTTNWHFTGIILFFILHGYSQYQSLIPVSSLLLLLIELLAAGIALYWLSKKIFRNTQKAAIFTSFISWLVLFFGVAQDFLADIRFTAPIARLTIFLPINQFAGLAFFMWLKRTKRSFDKLTLFINVLVAIYLVIDIFTIGVQLIVPEHSQQKLAGKNTTPVCDTCSKPPVYLILLDEYMGFDGAQQYYNYDNAVFAGFLQQQGFHILQHTHSNYQHTIYSMASLLNMEYPAYKGDVLIGNHYAFKKALALIRNNEVCRLFERQGYAIVNYSGFDIGGEPAGYTSELPDKIRLLNTQTMYYRVRTKLVHKLAAKNWVPALRARMEKEFVDNNSKMLDRTLADAKVPATQPRFTYLHLMMPHEPFSFDSTGARTPYVWKRESVPLATKKKEYLQYFIYTNKRIAAFISQLQQLTGGKAVIILMSDHGLRMATTEPQQVNFQNLNSIYLPQKNYTGWYDHITNVNQFRVLFNELFNARLTLMKDSLVYR